MIAHGVTHDNICAPRGVCFTVVPGFPTIVLPWMEYGNILTYINEQKCTQNQIFRFVRNFVLITFLYSHAHVDLRHCLWAGASSREGDSPW